MLNHLAPEIKKVENEVWAGIWLFFLLVAFTISWGIYMTATTVFIEPNLNREEVVRLKISGEEGMIINVICPPLIYGDQCRYGVRFKSPRGNWPTTTLLKGTYEFELEKVE